VQRWRVLLHSAFESTLRNIHALFQPFLPEKAHGYCVDVFGALPQGAHSFWGKSAA
jgi:hypothetical protein